MGGCTGICEFLQTFVTDVVCSCFDCPSIMQPNVFVAIIPDNFMFRAPGFLTYRFSSGDTINSISVFTTYPNGTLYTGINGSYVPDCEIARVMNVELDLYVNNQFHTQLDVTVCTGSGAVWLTSNPTPQAST